MLRCLVVDDEPQVAEVLKAGLETYCAAAVLCAESAASASRLLRSGPLDLAVIDLVLPDISGLDLAAEAADCNVPVLLVSGHLRRQAVCIAHGLPVLAKPFTMSALAEAAMTTVRDSDQSLAALNRALANLPRTAARAGYAVREAGRLIKDGRNLHDALSRRARWRQPRASSVLEQASG